MKLDIVYCRQCGGNHPPNEHTKSGSTRKPGDPPPAPPRSSWGKKPPTKPVAAKPKPTRRPPLLPRPKTPDFVATDPSSTPPLPTPAAKQTPEYLGRQRLLMRQKRAAERDGISLDEWRAKHGDDFMPPRQRRPMKPRKAKKPPRR